VVNILRPPEDYFSNCPAIAYQVILYYLGILTRYMEDTVTSNFSRAFWIKFIMFTISVIGSTIICAVVSVKNRDTYSWGQLASVGTYAIILIALYFYVIIKSTIIITAAREGIIVDYLITKKQIIIDYADIAHASNIRVNDIMNVAVTFTYCKLVIELTTGEYFTFKESNMTNYGELKEAIREFRFKLR
jgi:hypothetical protein